MATQILQIKNKGLHTAPNEFGVPQGALKRADHCVINDDDILESRRGIATNFSLPTGTDRAARYAFYQSKQIVAYSNGKIGYYSGGSFTAYSGTFSDADSTEAKRRFVKSANNLFVPTSAGVFRTDLFTTAPTLSGMYKGLDIQGTVSASAGAFFTADNQVAYRAVWGIKDANNNLIIGAPSGREVVINLTGGSASVVNLVITIPSGVTTSHFFQIYRSRLSGGDDIEPSDEMGLVYENNPTSGEITAGTISVTDSTPDDLTGATLYTSPSQQGILQANDRPPLAWDIAEFEGSMVYANTATKHRKIFTILAASSIAYNDTITIDGDVYTAKGTESVASLHYSLARASTFTANTNTSVTLTNVSSFISVKVGRTITGTDIPANTTITAFNSGAATITMSQAATGTTVGITVTQAVSSLPSQNIEDTARSLVRIINRNTTNNSVYAYYLSGEDDLPGQILIEERGLGGSSFAITASANGTSFNPVLPTSGTTVSSTNDDLQNQIMFSKTNQPEAVPLLNTRTVGSLNDKILRVVPLRNSLFIFKKEEGIYRVTGTSPSDFKVELFDSSARLIAPDSIAVLNNQIWCLTDQGVVRISETAVSIVSRPIEDLVLAQFGSALSGVRQYSWGMGYETERRYMLFTISDSADTVATQAFVFNTVTSSFTKWPSFSKGCGIVNLEDDKAYFGDGDSDVQEIEKKARDYTDFVDRGSAYTISSSSGTQVFLSSTSGIEAGDLLYESTSKWSVILEVQAAYVTTAFTVAWTPGAQTVFKGIPCFVEWAPIVGDNPAALKQFQEATFLFREATFPRAYARFATDITPGFEDVEISGSSSGQWGLFEWGNEPWGGTPFPASRRVDVPRSLQRGAILRVGFSHRNGYGNFKLNGFSLPIRMTESPKI